MYCGFHILNINGYVGLLVPPCALYTDYTSPIKFWAVRECTWEDFEAHPVLVHPPVDELSDMEVDLVRPKLTIYG